MPSALPSTTRSTQRPVLTGDKSNRITMLDLQAEYALFADQVRAAIDEVLASQRFIGGPAIEQLEQAIAGRVGAEHAIAVSNGTDALLCALMALGIGLGDEVVTPAFTFFATAGSIARCGATPVFVEIDPQTLNVDPDCIERAITERTRAIMVVHLYGQCAEMDAILTIARRHGLRVIEDAAQAIGAKYRGRCAGALADVACLSFYPTKNLGGFGEGGMILTGDAELATIARQLRSHGESRRYHHERIGGNFRLDTVKAAILRAKLPYLDEFTNRRRANAACYDRLLDGVDVVTPNVAPHNFMVYHQYTIRCDRRDELAAFLRGRGVDSAIYYPVPLHRQKCFAHLEYEGGDLPITERSCEQVLSLPCHPMLCEDDVRRVATTIRSFFDS